LRKRRQRSAGLGELAFLPMPWFLGAGLLLVTAKAAAATSSGAASEDDLDALTRMLIAETDFSMSKPEMAGIVNVALNRARKWRTTPASVVSPGSRPGQIAWNPSAAYRKRFEAASASRAWTSARMFVQQVRAGQYGKTQHTGFVHPSNMPKPPCTSEKHIEADTISGPRCIPVWAANSTLVGRTMFT